MRSIQKLAGWALIGLCLCVGCGQNARFNTQKSRTIEIETVETVTEYQDVRWKNLQGLEASLSLAMIQTLTFNETTIWPERFQQVAHAVLTKGMKPGLGITTLHDEGITGKGITVAIIDQHMQLDHPEFAGKVLKYHDVGCNQPQHEGSMHAPAVASLLVGNRIGTAPEARLYFVAAPSWTRNATYQAAALNWIVDENAKLPDDQKIRVVSISAAPSGPGSPFTQGNDDYETAYERATNAGILVLDCTSHHRITAPAYCNPDASDDPSQCIPGSPKHQFLNPTDLENLETRLFIPNSRRTQAEEYTKGEYGYQYTGQGGLSWTPPYVAGVLALGWQIRPDLTADQMLQLLFETASRQKFETRHFRIINPVSFVAAVKTFEE
jgi:subtilisin family serine protease